MEANRAGHILPFQCRRPNMFVRRLFNGLARIITGTLLKVDADQLSRIPLQGPLLIIVNHVNFLELPTIYPRIPSDLGTGFSRSRTGKPHLPVSVLQLGHDTD